jgi:hypothetical protein
MNEQRLQDIDLRQAERMRRLSHRLVRDLGRYDQLTLAIAEAESQIDMERVHLVDSQEGREETLAKLNEQRTKIILAIKSAVWSTSNSLQSDHAEGRVVRSQREEVDELLEEVES